MYHAMKYFIVMSPSILSRPPVYDLHDYILPRDHDATHRDFIFFTIIFAAIVIFFTATTTTIILFLDLLPILYLL